MAKPRYWYALKGADGTYYSQVEGKLWETGSLPIAKGMCEVAKKEKGQSYEVKIRPRL